MDNILNFNSNLNNDSDSISNKFIPLNKFLNKNKDIKYEYNNNNSINFNHKKRKRDININTNNINTITNKTFEDKFLSFEQFTNKIKEELKAYKEKGKQIFDKNNNYNKFNIEFFNQKEHNFNNKILLMDNNNISTNESSIRTNNNIRNININNYDNHISTQKKINNVINNSSDINSSQKKIIINNSSPKNNTHNDDNIIINNIQSIQTIQNIQNIQIYKNKIKIIKQIGISVISGITIIGFVYIISGKNQKNEIKQILNSFSTTSLIIILCFILIVIIFVLIYYKNKNREINIYNKISLEDFELLKKLLYENFCNNKEECIGIIQSQFIKDCSKERNISEEKYIKFILPLINKHIKEFNDKKNKNENNNFINNETNYDIGEFNFIIDESDLEVTGQNMKLWKCVKI